MNNSGYDKSNNSQNVLNVNENDEKLSKDSINTESIVHNVSENISTIINTANNEITYNDHSYDDANVLRVPEKKSGQVTHGQNVTSVKSCDNLYLNESPQTKILYFPNNNYKQFNSPTDRKLRSSNGNFYNFDANTAWNMNYPINSENYDYLNVQTPSNNIPDACNVPYNLVENSQLISPEHTTSPLYTRRANIHQNPPFTDSCHLNPYSDINPFYGRMSSYSPLHNNELNYLCKPTLSSYENTSPYINYNYFKHMPPHLYYLAEDKDNCSFLKKGIKRAMNVCNSNINESYTPKYEYIIQGPKLPYVNYPNQKKFDVFKKLTLAVGTYLDDAVNIMIDVLESSFRIIKKNNNTNLYDLYPFYNPDPIYSRQERPTLKTGSNLFDKINCALDGTTLEKHKNLPKNFGRIIVPKTEKTGHVVVDGINNILDNLLNEPLSYRNYDYFSDKFKPMNEIKQQ
ncbi:inner membrane complex suture component, putative [Plasmodium gallinaceum]|uniref:Inner membrane complex suture component, putative n=1 Tax=Plasmodium gallinaceum TaxID=5849 RepID=A0A1J1GRI6_PLAGA|nr:inner membrane complex suture component, putative [Plasmodium gallinaceum]CRG95121.1 inner membrane complex suture component, putative [Plasmodium gallinaceum]